MSEPELHAVTEVGPGVFGTLLAPCSTRVLPYLLVPAPTSFVWLVTYHPHHVLEWVDLPLPLAPDVAPRTVRARLPRYDLQFAFAEFLEVLPELRAPAGLLALQMRRPVPDTLTIESVGDGHQRWNMLRENGWLLSFDLPHDGEHAWVETPDRQHLERVLATPLFESRDLP
jgi:hypothetical protein